MPAFRKESGIPLLTGDVSNDLQALRTALYLMEEELRYIFNHLDTDNLVEGLSVSINDALVRFGTDAKVEIDTAGILSTVRDEIEGIRSSFEQTADKIILRVEQEVLEQIGFEVRIVSSQGSIFKNGAIETTLTAVLWRGKEDVTAAYNDACFQWTRSSADAESDKAWNARNATGKKSIFITKADVTGRATFFCTFTEPVTGVKLTSI